MATYYVSASAGGGGDGSIGNPWTLAEALTAQASTILFADTVNIGPGTYSLSASITFSRGRWVGQSLPKLERVSGTNTVIATIDNGVALSGVELDSNQIARGVSVAGIIEDCLLSNPLNILPSVSGIIRRCEISRGFNTGPNITITGICEQCYMPGPDPSIISSGSSFSNLGNCVARSAGSLVGWNGGTCDISGCVGHGLGRVINSCPGLIRDCIFVRSSNTTNVAIDGRSGAPIIVDESVFLLGYQNPTGSNVRGTPTVLSENPFIDPANSDYRLTDAAKSSIYAPQLKKIMAGIVGTPGVITDSLAELVSGSGAGFTGIMSNFGRLGT